MTGSGEGGGAGEQINTCYVMRVCATAGSILPGYRMSKHYVQSEEPIFAAVPFLPSNVSWSRRAAALSTECRRRWWWWWPGAALRLTHPPTDRPTDRPHLQQRFFLLCGEAASVTVRLGRRQLMWPVDVSDCSLYGQTPSRTGRSFTAVTSPRERLAAARSSRKQAGGRAQEAAPSRRQSKGGKGGETKGGGGSSGIQLGLLIAEPVLWLNTVLKSLQVVFEAVSHVAAAVMREIFSFIPLHCVHSSLNGSWVNSPKLKRPQMKTLKQQISLSNVSQ